MGHQPPQAERASQLTAREGRLANGERMLARVLELASEHLGMDVAWISELGDGEYRLRAVHDETGRFAEQGDSLAYDDTYCSRVLAGTLPSAIPDAALDPRTAALAVTSEKDIGSYVGVPIHLESGDLYGTLCCLSHETSPALDDRDVRFLTLLARVAADELQHERRSNQEREELRARIAAAIDGELLAMAFQPIVDVEAGRVVGVEALARFTGEPESPAAWFADAARVGLAAELEVAATAAALERIGDLPDGAYLSINASPEVAASRALDELLQPGVASRVQLEITERGPVADYPRLLAALARLRARGVRVAVDDAGAGYAGLTHVLRVRPDVIKLDMSLTRDIDSDPARAALAAALVVFAREIDATLVAEGVETEAELRKLASLNVPAVQGYLLARPQRLPLAATTFPALTATPTARGGAAGAGFPSRAARRAAP